MKQYYVVDTKELKAKIGEARVSFLRCYAKDIEDIELEKAEEIWKGYPYTAPSYRIKMEELNKKLDESYKNSNIPRKVLFSREGGVLSEVITEDSSIEIDANSLQKITYEEAVNYLKNNNMETIKNFTEKYIDFTKRIKESINRIPEAMENISLHKQEIETNLNSIRGKIR